MPSLKKIHTMSHQKPYRLQRYRERLTMIDGDTAIIEDHNSDPLPIGSIERIDRPERLKNNQ